MNMEQQQTANHARQHQITENQNEIRERTMHISEYERVTLDNKAMQRRTMHNTAHLSRNTFAHDLCNCELSFDMHPTRNLGWSSLCVRVSHRLPLCAQNPNGSDCAHSLEEQVPQRLWERDDSKLCQSRAARAMRCHAAADFWTSPQIFATSCTS